MQKYGMITGSTNGIGYEMSKIMAAKKHNLVLVARNKEKLELQKKELKNEFGIEVITYAKDLNKIQSCNEIFEDLISKQIVVNVLVNNAGLGDYGYFVESDWAKVQSVMMVNMVALTRLTFLFGNEMVCAGEGRILNVASVASFMPGPLMAVYYATKAYVLSLSEAVNNEFAGKNVSITSLCPGPVRTGFEETSGLNKSKLFSIFPQASAKNVAEFGYNAMMNGNRTVIYGFMFKFMIFSLRFFPKFLVIWFMRNIQGKRKIRN